MLAAGAEVLRQYIIYGEDGAEGAHGEELALKVLKVLSSSPCGLRENSMRSRPEGAEA